MIVAIGRNEGERLRRCLDSVVGRGLPVVYVDSATRRMAASSWPGPRAWRSSKLDLSRPFTAARRRNEGFERLIRSPRTSASSSSSTAIARWSTAGWTRPTRSSRSGPDVAAVAGRRRERYPERSIYNRLADVEWDLPVGEIKYLGGDMMVRADAFRQDRRVRSRSDRRRGPRLLHADRRDGWAILRIDAEMTLHDMAMTRFAQWWRRSVRPGSPRRGRGTPVAPPSGIASARRAARLLGDRA